MVDLETPRAFIRLLFLFVLFSRQNYAHAGNNNGTTNDTTGLTGALTDEELIYKKAVACQGQKLYISCANIYDKIQIQASFYGREDFTTCKHPELPSDKLCAEQNTTVKNVVKDLCQGESRCEVAVTNDFLAQFGTIICPNVYKYLYVKYRCVPKSALPDVPMVPLSPEISPSTVTTTSAVTPVQCCSIVPGISAGHVTTTETVGGTIIRNKEGTQSVEERIISEKPQPALQTSKITEIINGQSTQPTKNYSTEKQRSNFIQPSITQVEMNTLLRAQARKLGISSLISIDPSQLGSVIAKPNKRSRIPTRRRHKPKNFLKQIAWSRKRREKRFRIGGRTGGH